MWGGERWMENVAGAMRKPIVWLRLAIPTVMIAVLLAWSNWVDSGRTMTVGTVAMLSPTAQQIGDVKARAQGGVLFATTVDSMSDEAVEYSIMQIGDDYLIRRAPVRDGQSVSSVPTAGAHVDARLNPISFYDRQTSCDTLTSACQLEARLFVDAAVQALSQPHNAKP